MSKIVISPYAKLMRNGEPHPKVFPYWKEFVSLCNSNKIDTIQIGTPNEVKIEGITDIQLGLSFEQIKNLINETDTWASIDTFLPHLCAFYKLKKGIVIFGQSDPKIFGYPNNVNLLRDRRFLREHQMWLWEQAKFIKESFVSAEEVYNELIKILHK